MTGGKMTGGKMKANWLMIIIATAFAVAGCSGQAPNVMQSNAAYTEYPRQTSSAAPSMCFGLNGFGGAGDVGVAAP